MKLFTTFISINYEQSSSKEHWSQWKGETNGLKGSEDRDREREREREGEEGGREREREGEEGGRERRMGQRETESEARR